MHYRWSILIFAAAAVGCADTVEPEGDGWHVTDNDGTPNNNGTPNNGIPNNGAPNNGTPNNSTPNNGTPNNGTPNNGTPNNHSPDGTTFRLVNGHDRPVFVYFGVGASNPCGPYNWLEVLDGDESQFIQDDCSVCECGASSCGLCGAPSCAPGADPDLAQIGVGGVREFSWDGLIRERRRDADGNVCVAEARPEAETLTARFCWGHSWETTVEPYGEIREVECGEVDFAPGEPVVEHTIAPTARGGMQFSLTNSTNRTLYADVDFGCEANRWMSLSPTDQSDAALRLSLTCGQCLCPADAGACAVCTAEACALPGPEELALQPGESRSRGWNRTAYFPRPMGGCYDQRLVTGPLTATFCWADLLDGGQLQRRTCDVVTFDPWEDSHVIYHITDP